MGASVRIEDEAFSDERYGDLADAAGLTDSDHARGKMLRIWRQCTIEQTHILSREMVCRILGERGFEALIAARLGEETKHGVRIRGTLGRIEWLQRLRNNGKFGKKGGRPRRNPEGFPTKPTRVSKNTKSKTPPAPAPAPAPSEDLVDPPSASTPRGRTAPHPDHARAIDAFDSRYRERYGVGATWGPKQGRQIRDLLQRLGLDELDRRMDVLFSHPPLFLAGTPPDIGTLVQHIDKLVAPSVNGQKAHVPGIRKTRLL